MLRRRRSALALAFVLAVLLAPPSYDAAAQAPAPSTTPTTRSVLEELVTNLLPTTTAVPPALRPPASTVAPPATPPATTQQPTATVAPTACTGSASSAAGAGSGGSGGPRTSAPLIEALRRAQGSGAQGTDGAVAGMGRFPVGGLADYGDDWLAARTTPCFHLHKGTDIFAARGTPVRAPADGVVRFSDEAVGGRSVYVTEADGTYYYMAHLDSFAPMASGNRVSVGQVVGFVGDSGNASGGVTHVHMQIHPRGGGPVNPKPVLDAWLDEALRGVSTRASSFDHSLPRAVAAIDRLRRFEADPGAGAGQIGPLLWAAAVGSGGATIRLAEVHVARMAAGIDWSRRSSAGQAEAEQRRRDGEAARALLWPLTPPVIVAALDPGR